MREINTSSSKIADIIGVIDGIRIPDQHLGIECRLKRQHVLVSRVEVLLSSHLGVRSLAGRSAEAAREIKSLINASVESVERGTLQADKAGGTMQQVGQIPSDAYRTLWARLASASEEQSLGVAQVGQAARSNGPSYTAKRSLSGRDGCCCVELA